MMKHVEHSRHLTATSQDPLQFFQQSSRRWSFRWWMVCASCFIVSIDSASAQAGLRRVQFLALQQELRDQGCGVTNVDARYGPETQRAIASCARKFNSANNAAALLTAMNIGFGPNDSPPELTSSMEAMINQEATRVRLSSPPNSGPGRLGQCCFFMAPRVDFVIVPVFFATRRQPADTADAEMFFGPTDDHLSFGISYVAIERRRRPAKNDSPGWLCSHIKCNGPRERSLLVNSTKTLAQSEWVRQAHAKLPEAQRSALIFVHGFNVSFGDAMKAAGQLAYDTGFEGLTLAFDWASKSDPAKYGADQETAERSVKDFKIFLGLVSDSLRANPIDIVAHSLGTRLVSYALRDLAGEARGIALGQVVFAAADIDSATFVEQIADKITRHMKRLTLYASSNDRALSVSKNEFAHASPRVGSGPPHFILHERADYVDASNVETDFWGHGYYKESKPIIDDMFLLFRLNAPASRRNLAPVRLGSRYYYEVK